MLKIIKNVANIMFICGIIFTLGVAGSSDLATMSFVKILLLGIICFALISVGFIISFGIEYIKE